MHREHTSGSLAAATAIVMIGVAIAMGWLIFTGTVFSETTPILSGPLPGTEIIEAQPAELIEGMRIVSAVQFGQPRDPFRPLITEGAPGAITELVAGEQDGISVTLQEIRLVDETLRATIIVGGVTYNVGVGDIFAETFSVVSLDTDVGVFLNGDNAFELSVNQQILK